MGVGVAEFKVISQSEIDEWRRNQRRGHTRSAYELHDLGGRPKPESLTADEGIVDPRGRVLINKPSTPSKKVVDPRTARETYEANLIKWLRADRQLYMQKARMLRETSPLQFGHLTDDQLAQQIHDTIREKALAAVERNYNRKNWTKPARIGV